MNDDEWKQFTNIMDAKIKRWANEGVDILYWIAEEANEFCAALSRTARPDRREEALHQVDAELLNLIGLLVIYARMHADTIFDQLLKLFLSKEPLKDATRIDT